MIQTLEANGQLSNIRAQIRSSVFKIVDEPSTEKKVPFCLFLGLAISLGECQVSETFREGKWEGVDLFDQGVFPILQHGLH